MNKQELIQKLGIRNGIVRVGELKNDTPLETFKDLKTHGFRLILVMQSGLDLLTLEREKLWYVLQISDNNFKKKEELFEKYALQDDYEIVRLFLERKLLTSAEVRKKTEWAAERGLYKVTPLLLSYGNTKTGEEDPAKALQRLKAELAGNKKGCTKHFREHAEEFGFDRELVLLAVQKDGSLLRFVAPPLRSDKEIALVALAKDPQGEKPVLAYLSKRLYGDEEVIASALTHNPASITCLSQEEQNNRERVLQALRCNGLAYRYVKENFRADRELALLAIRTNAKAYYIMGEELLCDEEIGETAVSVDAELLADPVFRGRFAESKRVMLSAIRKDVRSMRYLSNEFRKDTEFAKEVLKIDKTLISGFFYNVQKDAEIKAITEA